MPSPVPAPAADHRFARLPILDLRALVDADPQRRAPALRQLRQACEDRGFFYLVGHGVPADLRAEVFDRTRGFFGLPDAEKARVAKSLSRCNRGWEPLRAQTLGAGAPPDLKEGFYIGNELGEDDPRVRAGRFNHGPNQWPDDPPGFRPAMERYFAAMLEVGAALTRALAGSLGLPATAFDGLAEDAAATLRLLHYPPQPANPHPGERGCGEHTDFGCLTLLMQDDCGGLQVLDGAGGWIDAPPVPDAYVVNLGDLVARWTNGRYRSTVHRVVNLSGRERYSVPFFFTGRPDFVVACLPSCLAPGEAPRLPPVTVEQHLAECYRRTYA